MKRIYFLAVCCLTICMLMACDSKKTNSSEEEGITVKGADGKEYTSYQAACRAQDFEAAHEILDILYDKYLEGYGVASDYEDISLEKVRAKYQAACGYIFKQEMMYCLSDGSEQASDKVLYLLSEIPVEGVPHPEGSYYFHDVDPGFSDGKEHYTYYSWVRNYNGYCTQILDLALSQNNAYLAKKVIGMYKQNIVHEEDSKKDSHYIVKYLWTDKESAIAKCKAAGIVVN